MTHLGADVAAFVDGQLSPEREELARRHLSGCERCRELVIQQEQLKRRMSAGPSTGVPAHLAAALAAVAADPGPADPRGRQALQRSFGVVVALVGASAAVLLLAYVLAPTPPTTADPVSPDFDGYAADFLQEAASERAPDVVAASTSTVGGERLSTAELDELDADGWPCHVTLAGDLDRIEGRLVGDAEVSLRYEGEHVQLHLIEQIGALEEPAMAGFDRRTVAGSDVWVREGMPTVVAWEAEGVVYTVVTDAGTDRIAQVVSQLPSTPARSTVERIEDGLHRMTSWVAAG
ncbi:anti-sigma factor [Aeromicrobium sp. Leaf350]|uniref:anti-sigma factor family protein n=1 Tax=Aeromicrobium sp. Leaf350 TaxID=2876565 RepID=UPI001E3A2312|nr:zf-HC2 domain-containing protein [Aeromicrobium sp. Leaf350]